MQAASTGQADSCMHERVSQLTNDNEAAMLDDQIECMHD